MYIYDDDQRCRRTYDAKCILPHCSGKVNRAWSVTALLVIHVMTYERPHSDDDDIWQWWWWHIWWWLWWLRCWWGDDESRSKDQIWRRFYQEANKSLSKQRKGFQSFSCIRNIITVPIQFFETGDHSQHMITVQIQFFETKRDTLVDPILWNGSYLRETS